MVEQESTRRWWCIGGCGRTFCSVEFPNDDHEGMCEDCWSVIESEMNEWREGGAICRCGGNA